MFAVEGTQIPERFLPFSQIGELYCCLPEDHKLSWEGCLLDFKSASSDPLTVCAWVHSSAFSGEHSDGRRTREDRSSISVLGS